MGSNPRWKKHERAVARALGTEREANDGRRHGDVLAGRFSVEVKTMRQLPARVVAALEQAARAAGTRTPVVVLSEGRQGVKARRLAVLDFADFVRWFGGLAEAPRPVAPVVEAPETEGPR